MSVWFFTAVAVAVAATYYYYYSSSFVMAYSPLAHVVGCCFSNAFDTVSEYTHLFKPIHTYTKTHTHSTMYLNETVLSIIHISIDNVSRKSPAWSNRYSHIQHIFTLVRFNVLYGYTTVCRFFHYYFSFVIFVLILHRLVSFEIQK